MSIEQRAHIICNLCGAEKLLRHADAWRTFPWPDEVKTGDNLHDVFHVCVPCQDKPISAIACFFAELKAARHAGVDKAQFLTPLRWHYGPTGEDPDRSKMWCYDCGGEVVYVKSGPGDTSAICSGCPRVEADGE